MEAIQINNIGALEHFKTGESMSDYLRQLDRYIEATNYQGKKETLLWLQVGTKVENQVKDLAIEGENDQQRYESISRMLCKKFTPVPKIEEEALEKFEKLGQTTETTEQFLQNLKSAAEIPLRGLPRDYQEKVIKHRFLEGLKDSNMRSYLKQRSETVEEMIVLMENLEKADRDEQLLKKISSNRRLSRIDSFSANLSQAAEPRQSPSAQQLHSGTTGCQKELPSSEPQAAQFQQPYVGQSYEQRSQRPNRFDNRRGPFQQQPQRNYQSYRQQAAPQDRNQSAHPGRRVAFVDEVENRASRSSSNQCQPRS